jgi:trehalose/maltose transport system substrate-binding protein
MAVRRKTAGVTLRTAASGGAQSRARVLAVGIFLYFLSFGLSGCSSKAPDPIVVTVLDPEWSQPEVLHRVVEETNRFTRETGIRVDHSPIPETSLGQLDLARKLLSEKSASPDLLGVDVIWPAFLGDYLLDLKPYFSSELSSMDPELVASYTSNGRVMAIPYHIQTGVLAYRTDLLRKYGYSYPPATWDELETIAAKIQAGERAEGKKDFWGYVWQGAAGEGLTCNALEWQVSQGGGRIIENDKTISVNNPAAIRAWQRAARWVGWISPPGVVAYREPDSMNAWDSGRAAFWRTWQWKYRLMHWEESVMPDKSGYTSVPGGAGGRVGTLGGTGLAVSQFSAHPQETMTLLRFLLKNEIEPEQTRVEGGQRLAPELVDLPSLIDPRSNSMKPGPQPGIISRPSMITEQAYEKVTTAYIAAVHSVLTHERSASDAAASLEKELVEITGFKTGPPQISTSKVNSKHAPPQN